MGKDDHLCMEHIINRANAVNTTRSAGSNVRWLPIGPVIRRIYQKITGRHDSRSIQRGIGRGHPGIFQLCEPYHCRTAGYLTCTPASYLSYAVGLFQHNAWFALLLVSIYTTMAAISGYVCYAVDLKGKGQERAMGPGPVAALELSFLSVLVIFIAAMVVVPAGTITLMLYTGLVEDETPSFSHTVAVYAVRTDDNTICVINLGGEGKNLLNEGLPFLVYIDGKNVTDSAAIKESGLSLDISPASRLGRKAGSSVNYTGTDAAFGNNSVHVLVVGNYRDGVRENLLSMDIGRDKAI